jgi:Co/Zn/Cd efflux system component
MEKQAHNRAVIITAIIGFVAGFATIWMLADNIAGP